NTGAEYLWSPGGETTQSISVSTAGTYSVIVTDANRCSATDNATVTVLTSLTVNLPATETICDGASVTLDAGFPGADFLWSPGGETTQTITTGTAGIYSVTVTDPNGCSGTASTEVIVNPVPVVNVADESICFGQSATLDAGNTGANFLWSNAETTQTITVSPADNTVYSVTVSNAFGCTASDNALVEVGGIRAEDVVVCRGDIATLTALGGTDYLWSTGETTVSIQVSTLDTISLTLTGTPSVGTCGNTATVFVYPVSGVSAAFTNFPDTFCSNTEPLLLDDFVSPTGGVFSGPGVSGNIFDPSQVLVGGPFTLSYAFTDTFGCSAQADVQFSVILAATVAL